MTDQSTTDTQTTLAVMFEAMQDMQTKLEENNKNICHLKNKLDEKAKQNKLICDEYTNVYNTVQEHSKLKKANTERLKKRSQGR